MEKNYIETYESKININNHVLYLKLIKINNEEYFYCKLVEEWLEVTKEFIENEMKLTSDDIIKNKYTSSLILTTDLEISSIYNSLENKIEFYFLMKNGDDFVIIKEKYIKKFNKIFINNSYYPTDYFINNYMYIFNFLIKTDNDYVIINKNNIYSVNGNKVGLKFDDELFFLDRNFLNIVKIVFNNKIYTISNFDEFKTAVYDYIIGYNTNIEILNLKYNNNAIVTLTIENIDKDFYFTEEPFEIEVPYGFDSFIKSKTIIKILKGRIGNHYKVWEGNIYKFEIKYNGRKEILYL